MWPGTRPWPGGKMGCSGGSAGRVLGSMVGSLRNEVAGKRLMVSTEVSARRTWTVTWVR